MDYQDKYAQLKVTYGTNSTFGLARTYLDNVHFFWEMESIARMPMQCDLGIVVIGQGHKVGYLNDKTFQYGKNQYLIASAPTAFECESIASKESPLFGIFIKLDLVKLRQMIACIEEYRGKYIFKSSDAFSGVAPMPMNEKMHQATERLLGHLQSPLDSAVLGQACVDEIIYHVLLDRHGKALIALTQQQTDFARIAKSLDYIHANYTQAILANELAQQVHMSTSSFYRAFKQVTGESPIQYVKKTRLNKARLLLVRDKLRVSQVANHVGYESVSQFSREFKRYFNIAPSLIQHESYIGIL